ncbi:MAG: radical SAM protein, partial [Anaerolineae bacterium]|nr:radical SAM protein [Anaerolineae bacterium]
AACGHASPARRPQRSGPPALGLRKEMLTGIHLLLTYTCNYECDHCFLYCGPHAEGTFTLEHLRVALDEAEKMGSVDIIYFEGGEPFLYYPLMVEGMRMAGDRGFQTGIVTNAYWATTEEDAELWLRPLVEREVGDLSLSDDDFHHGAGEDNPAKRASRAARRLGIPTDSICIDQPTVETGLDRQQEKGRPVIGGGAMFRGRAVEKLVEGLPTRPWEELTRCPYEDLAEPGRVHLDAFGHVHLCQGLSMGNMWETPLATMAHNYDPGSHPICGPLLAGGPALLARRYAVEHEEEYVDECHFCYSLRLALLDRFPQYLAPRQVYGLD